MKLVLKSDKNEEFIVVVQPDDTFSDLINRHHQNKKFVADLEKLGIPNKPFSLSENVMEYFEFSKKPNTNSALQTQCSSNSIGSLMPEPSDSPEYLHENVLDDEFIKQDVTGKIWSALDLPQNYELDYKDCKVGDNFPDEEEKFETDDLKNELKGEISEEGEEKQAIQTSYLQDRTIHISDDDRTGKSKTGNVRNNLKIENPSEEIEDGRTSRHPANSQNNSLLISDSLLSEQVLLCRLCAKEICDDDLVYIHNVTSSDGTTLADKMNACLPITVSTQDKLPKQVCSECLIALDFSFMFSQSVISAEESLLNLHLSTEVEHINCPLCCVGYMQSTSDPTDTQDSSPQPEDIVQDLTDTSEVVPSSGNINNLQTNKRKRPLKDDDYNNIDEDNENKIFEPAIDDEVEPPKKKTAQRGRPKGSKNKLMKPKKMNCFICYAKFNDFKEALQHASAHCDDLNETYPCPLCQSILSSESELSSHIDTHNNKREVVMVQCGLCGIQANQTIEIRTHVLEEHVSSAEEHYMCPLCQHIVQDTEQVVSHLFEGHVDHQNICPICVLSFSDPEEIRQHLTENHIEGFGKFVVCSECGLKTDSQEDCLNHIVDEHCNTVKFRVPAQYTCYACKNNFRTQYSLVKHTCNISIKALLCKQCNQGFPTKARLVFHLNTHELNSQDMRCDQCMAVFNNENTFYDHVRFQHEPDEQIQCEECNKVFKNELSLSMHMRRHLSTRDHQCGECGKKFQNAQTLREHQVSHMTIKPYQCHICGAYLSRLSRLRIHLRTHSVKSCKVSMRAYKCSVCNQLFPSTKSVAKHIEGHTEDNIIIGEEEVTLVYRCEYCDACFQQTSELQWHRKKDHPNPEAPNAYTCCVCGAQFSTYARVTTHKLTHGITTESLIVPDEVKEGEETFVIPQFFLCHECDKRCLHYTYMNLHRRFHHAAGKPVFPCNLCGEKFATSWSLTFHKKKKHDTEDCKVESEPAEMAGESKDHPFGIHSIHQCPECNKLYMRETSLEQHIKRCHQTGQTDNSNFICEMCGKTFHLKAALDAHTDAHKGFKRFECDICDRRFTHRAGLIRHMKLHSEDDPLVCEFCGKKFRDRTERTNHRRAHTGERPFMCEVCGRTFHTRAVWLDHSRIHQNIRPFQCDICNQSFRRSYALKSHYLIHTGEKPYTCEVCGRGFRLKQTLYSHNKKDCKKNDIPSQTVLSIDELQAEENSQFADNDGLSDVESDISLSRTFLSKSEDMLITEEVKVPASALLNPANSVKQESNWNLKSIFGKKKKMKLSTSTKMLLKDKTVGIQSLSQQGYRMLLKADDIKLN